jgi:hypothetical protein
MSSRLALVALVALVRGVGVRSQNQLQHVMAVVATVGRQSHMQANEWV